MSDNKHFNFENIADNISYIRLSGNIQGGNEALEFSNTLLENNNASIKLIVLDLENVKMMNSSGLGMLVNGLNTVKKKNIDLALINVPDKIQKLLEITHLDKVFKLYDNLKEAIYDYK